MTPTFLITYVVLHIMALVNGNSLPNNMTVLDMNLEQITCIDFDTLNQMKNLEKIKINRGNMPYFPDKDCSNPEHEEDTRELNLPILKSLYLKRVNLLKAPNSSPMPKLEIFSLTRNSSREIPGNQFKNNGNLKEIDVYDNSLTTAPNISDNSKKFDTLNLNRSQITLFPEDYFVGCNIRNVGVRVNRLTSFPNFDSLGDSVEEIIVVVIIMWPSEKPS